MPDITDEQLAALQARAEAGDSAAAALEETQQRLQAATEATLEQARAANPTIPAVLITGATADEIAASILTAQTIVTEAVTLNPPTPSTPDAAVTSPPSAPAAPVVPTNQATSPPRAPAPPPEGTRGFDRISAGIAALTKE
jgi:hypothetical protein